MTIDRNEGLGQGEGTAPGCGDGGLLLDERVGVDSKGTVLVGSSLLLELFARLFVGCGAAPVASAAVCDRGEGQGEGFVDVGRESKANGVYRVAAVLEEPTKAVEGRFVLMGEAV